MQTKILSKVCQRYPGNPIIYVSLVSMVNNSKLLLNPKMLLSLQDPQNCYTLISLVLLRRKVQVERDMVLSLQMTILDSYGFASQLTNTSLIRSLKYSASGFKMEKVFVLLQSEVIMVKNLKIQILRIFVSKMNFSQLFVSQNTSTKRGS